MRKTGKPVPDRIQASCGCLPYLYEKRSAVSNLGPLVELSGAEKGRIYKGGGEGYAKIKKRGRRW
jgi:hypothetical protein